MPGDVKQPFPYQAAQAAFWCPIIAAGIALATQSEIQRSTASSLIIGTIDALLILTSFICSLIALFSILKLGPRRLLFRGLFGLLFSSAAILSTLYLLFFFHPAFPNPEKIITGHWQSRSPDNFLSTLTINPDKHFDFNLSGPTGQASTSGTWTVAPIDNQFNLIFHIDAATGAFSPDLHQDIRFPLQEFHNDQFILINGGKSQTYNRLP